MASTITSRHSNKKFDHFHTGQRKQLQNALRSDESAVSTETAATLTVNPEVLRNKVITLDRAAGITVTLPAATGSGDRYLFSVITSVTSNTYTIQVASASDTMQGTAILFQDAGDTVVGFNTAASSDTLAMDGSTTGGLKGATAEFIDVATNVWQVRYVSDASGTEATPFSAAV